MTPLVESGGGLAMVRDRWTKVDILLAVAAALALATAGWTVMRPRLEPRRPNVTELSQQVEGVVLPPLPFASDGPGSSDTFRVGGARATLVLGLRSTCGACERNYSNWQAILSQVSRESDVSVVAVGVDPAVVAEAWLRERGLEADELVMPAHAGGLAADWRMRAVPATYVIQRGGRAVYARFGQLSAEDVQQVVDTIRSLIR